MRRLLRWCSWSLLGHIVLFEALVSVPSFIAFSLSNYRAGTLDGRMGASHRLSDRH